MRLLPSFGGRLYRKYVVYFGTLVGAVLLASGASDLYSSYYRTRDSTIALHREKAAAAAIRIEQFVEEMEQHMAWTNLLARSDDPLGQRHVEFSKLLRQAPAITDVTWLDANGREQLRVSRIALDRVRRGTDHSSTPAFQQARTQARYRGPVYFREGTEPYMTLAMAAADGATVAEVNLKFVWEVITRIRFGLSGHAYVLDSEGHLVSHPDISLVLKKSDLSALPQTHRALATVASRPSNESEWGEARDLAGRAVLVAHARIEPLGWAVFVEQDAQEAFAPLYASMKRTALLMLLGLLLALVVSALLARRMVRPIQALQRGAARLGAGELDQRIEVHTHDELETLAEEFNHMAARLRESHAGLELKVAERTEGLVAANQAKSRFLAAASHDLRQPMHALGLFVAQLRQMVGSPKARRVVEQAAASARAMEQLLDALLDISKLDAGVLTPHVEDFALESLLTRMQATFEPAAAARGLRLRAIPSHLVARSDPVLLERIVMNLVSNAVRNTDHGGVVIGCRRRGTKVRIEVWDSGRGIPEDKLAEIFQEFVQLANPERDRNKGLGLGLAIVERLALLLGHRIDLRSKPGKGSVFAVELPAGEANRVNALPRALHGTNRQLRGAFVVVVDDEGLVRDGMCGLLTDWGCHVIAAASGDEAIGELQARSRIPDLIISDYRLRDGETGLDVIRRLQGPPGKPVPALLISGDTAPERLREATASGHHLLHKPVQPAKLRAMLSHLLGAAVRDRAPG